MDRARRLERERLTLTFEVIGNAKTQGSKTIATNAHGQSWLREAVAGLKEWRHLVSSVAESAAWMHKWERIPKDSAVRVDLCFHFVKPKRGAAEYPRRRDIDKLTRAILDSITRTTTIWHDDDQVDELHAHKVFCLPGEDEGVEVSVTWFSESHG